MDVAMCNCGAEDKFIGIVQGVRTESLECSRAFCGAFRTVFPVVAHGGYLHIGHSDEHFHQALSAPAHANDTEADLTAAFSKLPHKLSPALLRVCPLNHQ